MLVLVLSLTGCRMDAAKWYEKPYTTYANEWIELWEGGKGFWNTLWGWPITILSYPIAWLCSKIGNAFGGSYFFGILFTTLIVRTLAWPIYSKQNGMSVKMQLMQPELNRIQAKYANRKDPQSQQKMQAETMAVYKKYKVNPLGCLGTMFLQFPIFMAMYEVVKRVNATSTVIVDGVEVVTYGVLALENTTINLFGLSLELNTGFMEAGATVADKIFAAVLAASFVGINLLSQKLAQKPPKYQKQRPNQVETEQQKMQKQQTKFMMIMMQVMFGFMSLQSTSLALYWLIGGIYQIGQSQIGRIINEKQYEKMKEKENL
jgi:YidC/Oxa1 family membrane protein insertase